MTALLESKYRVPAPRPGAVGRPRLTSALDGARRSAVTLVSAPAGFGKTTLLTQWLATVPRDETAVAWLSLDARDNDPARFWTYVLHAVDAAHEGLGAPALAVLAASAEAALATLLNDLGGLGGPAEREGTSGPPPRDLVLVLDDYHLVDAPEVHDAMRFVIDHQPPALHLVLATRADPPLPLAALRAGGRLAEVRAADLRFTTEESASYLTGPMGLELTGPDIDLLDGRTEGWIAALQLAALSMQGRDDVGAFIAGFAGDDRYIVDYLAEEVLARQSPDVRQFLLRTSVLERLHGSLCDAVTRRSDGRRVLVGLERANLFLVPLDARREWYRYHHLFAEVLQSHLREEWPDEVAELHRRASHWLGEHDDPSAAVAHALAGGDADRAADLMEAAMPVLTRERREGELRSWVRSLPDEVLRARPVLGVAFVGVLAQASDFAQVGPRLDDIERTVRPRGGPWPETPPDGVVVRDREAYRALPARVEMYRAALALAAGDRQGTVEHATVALSLTPADDGLTRAAAGALAGLASWAGGDLSGAHAAYTDSIAGLQGAGFVADVLGCCITLGDIRCVQGRLDDAMSTYQWALDLVAPPPGAPPLRGTADMHVGIAGVLLERQDLGSAAERLATATALGEANGLPQNPYRWRVAMARLREAEGDLDAALHLLDEAVRVYAGDYAPDVRPVAATRARLRLRRGERRHAEAWVRERRLSAQDETEYLLEYEHLTLVRVLVARHTADHDPTALPQALRLLERLRTAAEEGGRGGSLVEVLVLTAAALKAGGDSRSATEALRLAMERAEPEGYVRVFADEGPLLVPLLEGLAREGTSSRRAYVRRLLVAMRPASAGRSRSTDPTAPVDDLSARELEVLRLLPSDLTGPALARELYISLNTLRTHTKNIYAKLGATSRREAVTRAHELHLLPGRSH